MVLGVFWRSYDKGPISTIRRFHEAVRNRDENLLQRVVDSDSDSRSLAVLASQTRSLLARNANFEIAGIDTTKSQVRAAILYQIPSESPVVMVWVLDRQHSAWVVNPFKTMSLMEQLVNRPSSKG